MVDEVTIENLLDDEEITYPDTGIIPDSWYEYFGKDIPQTLEEYLPDLQTIREDGSGDLIDVDTAVETTDIPPDDRKVISLREDGSPVFEGDLINKDWNNWINNIIPFQEGDTTSNQFMTDKFFPKIDKTYDALSNIDLSDVGDFAKDTAQNVAAFGANTIANVPQTLLQYGTAAPFIMDKLFKGDPMGAATYLPETIYGERNSLVNYSDDGSLLKKAEPIASVYALRKGLEYLYPKLPTKLQNIMKFAYPFGTSRIDPDTLTKKKFKNPAALEKYNNRSMLRKFFGNSLSEIFNMRRGFGIKPKGGFNYGKNILQSPAARGILNTTAAGTAARFFMNPAMALFTTALTPSQSADHDEAGLNWERSQDPNKYNFSPLDFERENMNRMISRDNMRRNFEIANTRTTDQGPGPRDNYRGL
jgi:hypothetical protein